MAKKIVWTESSLIDRLGIYQFWLENNKSSSYSEKLEIILEESAKLISGFPKIGSVTNLEGVRVKIIKNYKIFYKISGDELQILRVWDFRQDPSKLKI